MKYGSFCTGVSADTLAVEPLGWEAVFFSEIDKFPSAVLDYHWPAVPNLGDMTKINGDRLNGTVEVIFGGTPCQGFSIAGGRKGMDDERSGLAMCFLEHISRIRPEWVVWENVPGVFSSWTGEPEDETIERWEETSDFDQFVAGLSQCGYGIAYRVLDVQFTRVSGYESAIPQRRRRVFVVGHLGDWRASAAVLFDKDSLSWSAPPERSSGRGTARAFEVGPGASNEVARMLAIGEYVMDDVASTMKARDYKDVTDIVLSIRERSGCDGGVKGALISEDISHTLQTFNDQAVICYENHSNDNRVSEMKEGISPTLTSRCGTGGGNLPLILENYVLRRFTPLECDRLMGFPDNYTRIPWRGKPAEDCPDSHRYKACGNSIGVNVIRWIAMRIDIVSELLEQLKSENCNT